MAPSRADTGDFLGVLALERARAVLPVVGIGMLIALALSPAMQIAVPRVVLAANGLGLVVLGALHLALARRQVPARRGHAALFAVWAVPVASTVTSMIATDSEALVFPLLLEVGAASFMLSTRWSLGALLALDAVWIPLAFTQLSTTPTLSVVVIISSQIYTLLFQRSLVGWVRRTEAHRREHEATAAALAAQLDELRRTEAERAALADQLLHSQRMESAGTLAAGLAHDMNNILASIQSFAELLLHDAARPGGGAAPAQREADLRQIMAQAERGAHLTRALLAFSRRGQYRKQVVEVDAALERLVPLLSRTLPKAITLETRLAAADARVDGDPTQLDQVLVNLAVNAADAITGRGTITLSSRRVDLDAGAASALGVTPGAYVRLDVTDTGAGMDDDTRRRVFEPFFTTKPIGKGTGLGLAMVWGVVHGHGGAVTVASEVGRGTTFTLHLPAATAAPPRAHRDTSASVPIPVVRATAILVVDDEPAVRAGTARLLERKGFVVHQAANGEEALAVFADHADDIALVVLDMGMPVMDGAECFAHLRARSEVPVLIATGYTSDEQAQALTRQGAALIEKPFAAAELGRAVKHLLGRPSTPSDRMPVQRRAASPTN